MSYKLINPTIFGDFENKVKAENANSAAVHLWSNISKYVSGNVPNFPFTIIDESDNMHHYVVKEKAKGETADYDISPIKMKMDKKTSKKIVEYIYGKNKQIGGKMQTGGRRDKDDDSSDSDEDELYQNINLYKSSQPITYWWYNPIIYSMYAPKFRSLYIPTFTAPIYPYIELDLSSAAF